MSDTTNTNGGGNTLLALIVGGLLVVVVGFFVVGGNLNGTKSVDVNVKAPVATAPGATTPK